MISLGMPFSEDKSQVLSIIIQLNNFEEKITK